MTARLARALIVAELDHRGPLPVAHLADIMGEDDPDQLPVPPDLAERRTLRLLRHLQRQGVVTPRVHGRHGQVWALLPSDRWNV